LRIPDISILSQIFEIYLDILSVLYRIPPVTRSESKPLETTYSVRTASRLTGVSPELLRAWERRHRVVEPFRTPGGTRRYRTADLEKLRLVKAVVDAGHRIGRVARMDPEELRRSAAMAGREVADHLDDILSSVYRLDAGEVQRMLSLELMTLGPTRFAREVAIPLLHEIGERWAEGQLGIAQEHLGSGVLGALLGSALQPTAASLLGPKIVFGTPTGERHELGLRMAALTALAAGASPIYLGADLPVDDLLGAVEATGSQVLALSLVAVSRAQAQRSVGALRGGMSSKVQLWLGGVGARDLAPLDGVEHIESLEDLERKVVLLGAASAP
jgi:DNA-binding transcriptional MerR regulator